MAAKMCSDLSDSSKGNWLVQMISWGLYIASDGGQHRRIKNDAGASAFESSFVFMILEHIPQL